MTATQGRARVRIERERVQCADGQQHLLECERRRRAAPAQNQRKDVRAELGALYERRAEPLQ